MDVRFGREPRNTFSPLLIGAMVETFAAVKHKSDVESNTFSPLLIGAMVETIRVSCV